MIEVGFLSKDLLFQSRVSSAASSAGAKLMADRTADRLVSKFTDASSVKLIMVDLTLTMTSLDEELRLLRQASPQATIVAYGPHVQEEKLQEAIDAGFDCVMTRGQFDRDMLSLVQEACSAS